MRVTIAALGKMKPSPEQELLTKYLRQTPWQIAIKELEVKKNLPTHSRMQAEAALLQEACADAHIRIALDERGQHLSSEALAAKISGWQQQGHSHLAFLIGGQDGLDESIRKQASLILSFGALTWPHMLVRAMLGEQLYRCHTILTGHPYHRS